MYASLEEAMKLGDNNSIIEEEFDCFKPCTFLNPIVIQEFKIENPGLCMNTPSAKGIQKPGSHANYN